MGQYLDTCVDDTKEQCVSISDNIYYQNNCHEKCQQGAYFTNWDELNQHLDMDE